MQTTRSSRPALTSAVSTVLPRKPVAPVSTSRSTFAAATGALAGETRLVRQFSGSAVFQISTVVSFEEAARPATRAGRSRSARKRAARRARTPPAIATGRCGEHVARGGRDTLPCAQRRAMRSVGRDRAEVCAESFVKMCGFVRDCPALSRGVRTRRTRARICAFAVLHFGGERLALAERACGHPISSRARSAVASPSAPSCLRAHSVAKLGALV